MLVPKKWKPKSNLIKLEKVKVNGVWENIEYTEDEEETWINSGIGMEAQPTIPNGT